MYLSNPRRTTTCGIDELMGTVDVLERRADEVSEDLRPMYLGAAAALQALASHRLEHQGDFMTVFETLYLQTEVADD